MADNPMDNLGYLLPLDLVRDLGALNLQQSTSIPSYTDLAGLEVLELPLDQIDSGNLYG